MVLEVMMLGALQALVGVMAPGSSAYSGLENQIRVTVPRIEEAEVVIDGLLDEPVWAGAATLTGFSQYAPADGRPAENQTAVLVWYSPTAIYFGVRAYASPGSVRVALADRDKIEADDSIEIYLSTFNDGRQAFVFGVNPFGIQSDGALIEGVESRRGGSGGLATGRDPVDLSPDFVFDSKGRLTDYGYAVELRIPFKSLPYQASEKQDWGIHVIRRVQSLGHEDSWVPARRSGTSFLAQAGTLAGLTGLRRGLVLDLNPVVTMNVDGAPAGRDWTYQAGSPDVGANLRWGVTSNLTLNGAVNPDFSQVESDAGQFSYDPRRAVFFPEKRPFFLEGLEQFTTPNRLIYTRRIADPVVAAKLTGKVGSTRVAMISALDDFSAFRGIDRSRATVARIQHDLGKESRAAFIFTDRAQSESFNRVVGADANLAFGGLYRVQLQGAVSRTSDGALAATAPLWEAILNRNGRRFGFRYALTGIDENFRASNGFIARGGIAHANVDHRLTLYGKPGARIESWSGDIVLDGIWLYRDFVTGRSAQDRKLHFNNNFTLRGGWKTGFSVLLESFGFDSQLYADYALEQERADGTEIVPFVGTPRLPNLDYVFSLETPRFSQFSSNLFLLWGRDENFFEWSSANIVFARLSADWRPTDQVRVNLTYQLQHYRRRSDGSTVGVRQIPRLKLEYQFSRSVFVRVVGELTSERQDDLRDDGRTEAPILIRDPVTSTYRRASAFERNRLRVDWLFSYQPSPGTVFYAGYGSSYADGATLGPSSLRRVQDGFFVKLSYLFRL